MNRSTLERLHGPALPYPLALFQRANQILIVVVIAGVKQRTNSVPPFFYLPDVKHHYSKDTSRDHRDGENITAVLGWTKGPSDSSGP